VGKFTYSQQLTDPDAAEPAVVVVACWFLGPSRRHVAHGEQGRSQLVLSRKSGDGLVGLARSPSFESVSRSRKKAPPMPAKTSTASRTSGSGLLPGGRPDPSPRSW
jgi:hypothetical protein